MRTAVAFYTLHFTVIIKIVHTDTVTVMAMYTFINAKIYHLKPILAKLNNKF